MRLAARGVLYERGKRSRVCAMVRTMTTGRSGVSDAQQDWRLEAELDLAGHQCSLHDLVGRVRGPDPAKEAQASAPNDVVVTHDGKLLFAYAADEATIKEARQAIEHVLRDDGIDASIRLSHWDDELDDWHQTDPPATAQQQRADDDARRNADTIEKRTLVASLGKEIRSEFEQSMLNSAAGLGVECNIIEHPHLLTTQVGFTVTGPKRKIAEFVEGLTAEERATVRTDTAVMLSPL